MNKGGNFLKNKFLNFGKKDHDDLDEDIFDNQNDLNDDEFFDDFFDNSKKAPLNSADQIPQPIKKAPQNNYANQLNASAAQITKPAASAPVNPVAPVAPTKPVAPVKPQANNDYDSYKYDFGNSQNFQSTQAYTSPQKVAAPVQQPKPPVKQKAPQSSYASLNLTQNSNTKVYALVLKSADDVRAVVDCMMETQIVAIYVDMTKLSKLDERRALDFIDGAKYVLKTNVKCISPKIYMVTPKNIAMDGDFMDFNDKAYARAQGEFNY